MRCYAKVCLGWDMLYLGFFWRNSTQEDAVASYIEKVLKANPGAVASVSEECTGALAELPVIGEFPLLDLSTISTAPPPLSPLQLSALESMRDGTPKMFVYKGVLTAKALLSRGYAERATNMPAGKTWIRITEAGREKLAEMELGREAAE